MNNERQKFVTIGSKSLVARIGLAAAVLFAVVFVWFSVAWQLGNMFAGITDPTDLNAEAIADTAIWMAPRDPMAQWLRAVVIQDRDASNYKGFEQMVRLSPYDYRWWGQMGRAFEQAEESKKAEAAFEYANLLAPNYVLPKWQAGNFYLRQGDEKKASEYLKHAASLDGVYREQVLSIVWDYFDQDVEKLESLAGDSPEVVAGLAKFYASKGLPQRSLRAWNRLSKNDRAKNAEVAKLVAQALYDKGFFNTSVEFINELGLEKGAATGKIHNGGFEEEIMSPDTALFSWKIVKVEGMRVQTNSFKKKSGKRSLEVSFAGYRKSDIGNVFQTVSVKPGARYKLEFWLKTEKLVSGGLPILQVTTTAENTKLATSKAFASGTNDWAIYSVVFTVPSGSEAVSIWTSREYCGESCTLTGSFWYDDFSLSELK